MARAPAGDGSDADVTYQHGVDEVLEVVARPTRRRAAVLIRPVSVAEIERTAREGLLMPPKSTFFTPKLRTGFVVRELGLGGVEHEHDALDQFLHSSSPRGAHDLVGEHLGP